MPSYPASVKSFTAKASGQNIDPAHINDIQDEINAIEAGLLNGTAPLNSSGSTMARLQVTGGSTFTLRPTMPPTAMAQVFLDDVTNLTNDSTLAVAWTGDAILTNSSMHSTGTNPLRLTPQTTGVYLITAGLRLSAMHSASTGNFTVSIADSSHTVLGSGTQLFTTPGQVTEPRINLTTYKRFDTLGGSPWVRVVAFNRDGSSASLSTLSYFAMGQL